MKILGISAYYHDSAAAIIEGGNIIAASLEERYTGKKGDNSFPHNAINFCLNEAKISLEDVDYIVFYEDSILKFDRIFTSNLLNFPKGYVQYIASMSKWLSKDLWIENEIKKELHTKKKIYFSTHHMSHAASAFYPSPFKEAAIITVDGVGQWHTTCLGYGNDNKINLFKCIEYPNSLGLFYSAFTYYLGFKINSGEYKVMGLAPYGKPIYVDLIKKNLIKINEDGSIILNQKYFGFTTGLKSVNKKFCKLFNKDVRKREAKITKKDADIAASLQAILNECMLKMANYLYEKTKCKNLVLAGGVALNVASNAYLKKYSKFENIWAQPASSDAGGALGAAFYQYYQVLNNKRIIDENDSMKNAYLGDNIKETSNENTKILDSFGAIYKEYDKESLAQEIAKYISEDKIVAIARGKMEFGPRALGNRSIIASAISDTMQQKLNLKVKKREGFRPFAPMVLKEDAKKYFKDIDISKYMLFTYEIKDELKNSFNLSGDVFKDVKIPKSKIPAVTHVDYSSRVQTVDKDSNYFMSLVLNEYKKITGESIVVNTSFNLRGEPIVNSVKDAYKTFMSTDIDYLVVGNILLNKKDQPILKKDRVKVKFD